jgi:hypothetical protein
MARKKARGGDPGLRGLADGRLSYGTPVSVDGRTVIPVTRLRVVRSGAGDRTVESVPMGFIEVTGEGSSFQPIGGPSPGRALRAAVAIATTVAGAVAGARALRTPRRPPRLLPPGRPRLPR